MDWISAYINLNILECKLDTLNDVVKTNWPY